MVRKIRDFALMDGNNHTTMGSLLENIKWHFERTLNFIGPYDTYWASGND